MTERIDMKEHQIVRVPQREEKAPCNLDGEVVTVDNDNKLARCTCGANPEGCWVDNKNRIIKDSWSLLIKN